MKEKKKGSIFRLLRIAILLYIFVMVAMGSYFARVRSTDWNDTLYVAVFPINGDGSSATADYIARLEPDTFAPIDRFLAREGPRYGMTLATPLKFQLSGPVTTRPPPPPVGRGGLSVVLWSLKLRYYTWREEGRHDLLKPDIRMFVQYFDPEITPALNHSVGLQKGLVGVVNAYAARRYAGTNNFVITHELMHTLGATDKYDPVTNQPLFPDGFAEPERTPRWPQSRAEIMGGRIPVSSGESTIPRRLSEGVVGPATAGEINWRAAP